DRPAHHAADELAFNSRCDSLPALASRKAGRRGEGSRGSFVNFQFDAEMRRRLGYRLIDRINEYFDSLANRSVQLPVAERTFGELSNSLPELGADALQVLDDLCTELIDKGFHVPSANYFGLMNPTPTYMSVLAEALVAALNPQLATLARSQLASKIAMET